MSNNIRHFLFFGLFVHLLLSVSSLSSSLTGTSHPSGTTLWVAGLGTTLWVAGLGTTLWVAGLGITLWVAGIGARLWVAGLGARL